MTWMEAIGVAVAIVSGVAVFVALGVVAGCVITWWADLCQSRFPKGKMWVVFFSPPLLLAVMFLAVAVKLGSS